MTPLEWLGETFRLMTWMGIFFAPACVIAGWWVDDEAVAAIGIGFLLVGLFGYLLVT